MSFCTDVQTYKLSKLHCIKMTKLKIHYSKGNIILTNCNYMYLGSFLSGIWSIWIKIIERTKSRIEIQMYVTPSIFKTIYMYFSDKNYLYFLLLFIWKLKNGIWKYQRSRWHGWGCKYYLWGNNVEWHSESTFKKQGYTVRYFYKSWFIGKQYFLIS